MKSFSKEKWRQNEKNEKGPFYPGPSHQPGQKGGSCAPKRPPHLPPFAPVGNTARGKRGSFTPGRVTNRGKRGGYIAPGQATARGKPSLFPCATKSPAAIFLSDAVRLPDFRGEPPQRRRPRTPHPRTPSPTHSPLLVILPSPLCLPSPRVPPRPETRRARACAVAAGDETSKGRPAGCCSTCPGLAAAPRRDLGRPAGLLLFGEEEERDPIADFKKFAGTYLLEKFYRDLFDVKKLQGPICFNISMFRDI